MSEFYHEEIIRNIVIHLCRRPDFKIYNILFVAKIDVESMQNERRIIDESPIKKFIFR